jgi:ABC-type antimicrobial peptide transport system permease subunit
MLSGFAAIALVLAALGIYGVVAYSVSQRTREIGVRMALGARLPQVVRLVIRQELRAVAAGVAAGVGGALAGGRVIQSFLVGVTATDPATLVAVPALFLIVAIAAVSIPARRAGLVDPVAALREDARF